MVCFTFENPKGGRKGGKKDHQKIKSELKKTQKLDLFQMVFLRVY